MALSFFRNINVRRVLSRFPLPILFSSIISVLLILLSEDVFKEGTPAFDLVVRTILTLAIGFLVFSLLQIIRERYKFNTSLTVGSFVGGTILILLYYAFFTHFFSGTDLVKFFGLFAALALIVPVVAYIKRGDYNDFWYYSKNLLLRFVETAFYSAFIFGSISIALLALDKLFGITFHGSEIYFHLFLIISGVFFPISFFSRIPEKYSFTQKEESSAAFLIFAQKILIPIVNLYALILIAYAVKILVLWSWPKGWISNMIIWFSIFGIFTYVLNYLIINKESNAYYRGFKKYFFFFLFPFTIMLILAVGKRISDYGITEKRYIVASLGVWLLLLSLYFIVSKKDNIKIVPTTLSLLIVFSLLGPFNMFKTTLNSQFNRLETLLTENDMLKDNKVYRAENLSPKQEQRIYDQINTIDSRGGLDKIKKWDDGSAKITTIIDSLDEVKTRAAEHVFNRYYRINNQPNARLLTKELNLTQVNKYNRPTNNNQFFMYAKERYNIPVNGFDQLIYLQGYVEKPTDVNEYYLDHLLRTDKIHLKKGEVILDTIQLAVFLEQQSTYVPGEKIIWDYESEDFLYQFHFTNISGELNNDKYILTDLNGLVLIKEKK